ncbi:MAG: serine hydrolase domain-containing protein [Eggerthella lenta]
MSWPRAWTPTWPRTSRERVRPLAVAVVDAGGVRYLRTFGDCPDADAPFVVGSLSKSFTAVAVMQLVEQGAVDLDAPASRYAPGYDVPDEVTVRSLLKNERVRRLRFARGSRRRRAGRDVRGVLVRERELRPAGARGGRSLGRGLRSLPG